MDSYTMIHVPDVECAIVWWIPDASVSASDRKLFELNHSLARDEGASRDALIQMLAARDLWACFTSTKIPRECKNELCSTEHGKWRSARCEIDFVEPGEPASHVYFF